MRSEGDGLLMTNEEQLQILKSDVQKWNVWRKTNPKTEIDLRGTDLSRADLRVANLRGANLSRADLRVANLRGANLSRADLSGANLSRADLTHADLSGTQLHA